MLFVNHQELARTLLARRRLLPPRIDLVVGVPRSGMIPAAMLATQLNVPLADVDTFLAGRVHRHGFTKSTPDLEQARSESRVVLIVDDVVGSGRSMRHLKSEIARRAIPGELVYCAVFSPVRRHPDVDIVLQQHSQPVAFPWNLMHHALLEDACVDIDGVLCANPEAHESFEGKAYEAFLEQACQLHATSGKIGWLVTSRLQRHRAVTEAWLSRHRIEYGCLIMATEEEKQCSPAFKARIYQETGARLFIESEAQDAAMIASLSGQPVICIETLEQIMPGQALAMNAAPNTHLASPLWRQRKAALKLGLRSIIGDTNYYAIKQMAHKAAHPLGPAR